MFSVNNIRDKYTELIIGYCFALLQRSYGIVAISHKCQNKRIKKGYIIAASEYDTLRVRILLKLFLNVDEIRSWSLKYVQKYILKTKRS